MTAARPAGGRFLKTHAGPRRGNSPWRSSSACSLKLSVLPLGPKVQRTSVATGGAPLAESLVNESSVALVDGYHVAGKTGTAQLIVNGSYDNPLTNASFVGWGPVDEPRFLIYVWLEHPESSPWGSVVAAPVFRDVFTQMAILADLPPDEIRWDLENQ